MLKPLLKLEEGLLKIERALLVFFVLAMLLLAGYTVFYRNILVPWQNRLMVSGPPVVLSESGEDERPADEKAAKTPAKKDAVERESDDFAGGFGGDFAGGFEDESDKDSDDNSDDGDDFAGGFGGDFDDDSDKKQLENPEKDENNDFSGGFGGDFDESGENDENVPEDEVEEEDDFSGGFGGDFGGDFEESADSAVEEARGAGEELDGADHGSKGRASKNNRVNNTATQTIEPGDIEEPGGPPPEGSFGAAMISAIDALKFSWIDVLIRQLVLVCGFLGAMLAARRRNHISVDIFSRFLKGRRGHIGHAVTSLVAALVCAFLAVSGWRLVQLGVEFPRQLMPWMSQWQFQLIFPIGWGLLAFHFLVRVAESVDAARRGEPIDGAGGAIPVKLVDSPQENGEEVADSSADDLADTRAQTPGGTP